MFFYGVCQLRRVGKEQIRQSFLKNRPIPEAPVYGNTENAGIPCGLYIHIRVAHIEGVFLFHVGKGKNFKNSVGCRLVGDPFSLAKGKIKGVFKVFFAEKLHSRMGLIGKDRQKEALTF